MKANCWPSLNIISGIYERDLFRLYHSIFYIMIVKCFLYQFNCAHVVLPVLVSDHTPLACSDKFHNSSPDTRHRVFSAGQQDKCFWNYVPFLYHIIEAGLLPLIKQLIQPGGLPRTDTSKGWSRAHDLVQHRAYCLPIVACRKNERQVMMKAESILTIFPPMCG